MRSRPGWLAGVLVMMSLCGARGSALAQPAPGPAARPNAEAVALLRQLPWPRLEPQIRWDWDPTAFEPLAHATPEEFRWRIAELKRTDRPPVVYARLNLELAFFDAAAGADAKIDSLGVERRARLAMNLYRQLLSGSPGQPEYLTDLGDLMRFTGEPDSALAFYRQAAAAPKPPARVFARLAGAELEVLDVAARPDSAAAARFQRALTRGGQFFAAAPPADSLRAARYLLEKTRFRIDRNVLETRASQRLHPEQWRDAGVDSSFAMISRIISPETRRTIQAAAEQDTNLAEAWGMLGSIITGQILLPVAGKSLLALGQPVSTDSLTAILWSYLKERNQQRGPDGQYAAACLNRCEQLAPGRYPRIRHEQARLALLMGDSDGATGLWRSLMSREPARAAEYAGELYTGYALEPRIEGGKTPLPSGRMADALGGKVAASGGAGALSLFGLACAETGRLDEARVTWLRALAADSTEWRARLGLAVLALRELDAPAAEPHLKRIGAGFGAVDGPGRGLYCGAVGLLYWARDDLASAHRWLDEAIRFDPRNDIVRQARARLPAAPVIRGN